MGCSQSHSVLDVYRNFPVLQPYKEYLDLIDLTHKEIYCLYRVYTRIDKDKDGEVEIDELLQFLNIEYTPFSRRVFGVIDGDGSGTLNFQEFVEAMFEYCTLTKESLVKFAFNLYDEDNSGTIEIEEMVSLCKDVYGKAFKKSKLCKKIIQDVRRMVHTEGFGYEGSHYDPLITLKRFSKFCNTHTGLLYPAFQFQRELREKIEGDEFWRSVEKRKMKAQSIRVQQLELYKAALKESRKKRKRKVAQDDIIENLMTVIRQESETGLNINAVREFRNSLTTTPTLVERIPPPTEPTSKPRDRQEFLRTGKRAKSKRKLDRRTSSFDSDAAQILRQLQKEEEELKRVKKKKPKRNRHGMIENPKLKRRHSSVCFMPPGAIA